MLHAGVKCCVQAKVSCVCQKLCMFIVLCGGAGCVARMMIMLHGGVECLAWCMCVLGEDYVRCVACSVE